MQNSQVESCNELEVWDAPLHMKGGFSTHIYGSYTLQIANLGAT